MITDAIAKVKPKFAACGEVSGEGHGEAGGEGEPRRDGRERGGERDARRRARRRASRRDGSRDVSRRPIPADRSRIRSCSTAGRRSATCDATKLSDEGIEKMTQWDARGSARAVREVARVQGDPRTVKFVFMASCNVKNEVKAKYYFAKMSTDEQSRFESVCVRNGIDPRGGTQETQDPADSLRDQGIESVMNGEHAAALRAFEVALESKPSNELVQLAFIGVVQQRELREGEVLLPAAHRRAAEVVLALIVHAQQGRRTSPRPTATPTRRRTGHREREPGQACCRAHAVRGLACLQADDPFVVQLAFMAACNSHNSPKAKRYYKQLTPAAAAAGLRRSCASAKVEYRRRSGTGDLSSRRSLAGETGLDRRGRGRDREGEVSVVACGEKFRSPGKLKLKAASILTGRSRART